MHETRMRVREERRAVRVRERLLSSWLDGSSFLSDGWKHSSYGICDDS